MLYVALFMLSACGEEPPTVPPESSEVIYTVTESEWKANLNLTKSQAQPQLLSCATMGAKCNCFPTIHRNH